MSNLLILYPKLFNCYTKFARKISRITSNLGQVTLVYPNDPNQFIQRLCSENTNMANSQLANWSTSDITHAIVFDDGEAFIEEIKALQLSDLPLRRVKIRITRVVNITTQKHYKNKRNTHDYEYIGRGGYWGNPYPITEEMGSPDERRSEVIRKFKYDFDFDKFPNKRKSEVFKLAGKSLGCFCKPKACHGDVLAEFLNAWDDGL